MRQEIITDARTGEVTVIDLPDETEAELAAKLAIERAAMRCSRFQAKAALLASGLLPAVETYMETADAMTKLAWAEAVEFRRDSPLLNGLAATFNLSPEQIDDLFRAAAQIAA